MVRINNITYPDQYVIDFKQAESIHQAGMLFQDVWEDTQPEGWLSCIGRMCCLPYTLLKKVFYKICCSWWEKKPPTLADIRKGIHTVYHSLQDPTSYRNAFSSLPESLRRGILSTTMKMLQEEKLLRTGMEPPKISSEDELKKLAEEILANPLHERFYIEPVFADYIEKLK